MFELNLSGIGWIHTVFSIFAMLAVVPVMLARKGSRVHRGWGRAYAIAYLVVCVTSFGIGQRFWFPHWLAVAGLAALAIGYLAARMKPRGWRYIHLTAMLLSAYNLYGGAVNEAFLRVRPLRAAAGEDGLASPLVGMTHGAVMFVFFLLIASYAGILAANRTKGRAIGSVSAP
jgi:uncharacterized membrane protein